MPLSTKISRQCLRTQTTIASGQTKSGVIDIRDHTLFVLHLPAAFTGTAITFEGSDKANGTFNPIYNASNAAVSVTVVAARSYELPTSLAGFGWIKIVSGSAEGAARTLVLTKKA